MTNFKKLENIIGKSKKINIEFQMIDKDNNLAKKSINAKELKTKNG